MRRRFHSNFTQHGGVEPMVTWGPRSCHLPAPLRPATAAAEEVATGAPAMGSEEAPQPASDEDVSVSAVPIAEAVSRVDASSNCGEVATAAVEVSGGVGAGRRGDGGDYEDLHPEQRADALRFVLDGKDKNTEVADKTE